MFATGCQRIEKNLNSTSRLSREFSLTTSRCCRALTQKLQSRQLPANHGGCKSSRFQVPSSNISNPSSSLHDNHHLPPLRNLSRCVRHQHLQAQPCAPGPDTLYLRSQSPPQGPTLWPPSQLRMSPNEGRNLLHREEPQLSRRPGRLASKALSAEAQRPRKTDTTRITSPTSKTMPPSAPRSRTGYSRILWLVAWVS